VCSFSSNEKEGVGTPNEKLVACSFVLEVGVGVPNMKLVGDGDGFLRVTAEDPNSCWVVLLVVAGEVSNNFRVDVTCSFVFGVDPNRWLRWGFLVLGTVHVRFLSSWFNVAVDGGGGVGFFCSFSPACNSCSRIK
jgi:hypothetical protein